MKYNIVTEHTMNTNNVTLNEVKIGDDVYKLSITNFQNALDISFNNDAYKIFITADKKIIFSRARYRKNHDHDNTEHLYIVDKTGNVGVHWDNYSNNDDNDRLFEIIFGPVNVDY